MTMPTTFMERSTPLINQTYFVILPSLTIYYAILTVGQHVVLIGSIVGGVGGVLLIVTVITLLAVGIIKKLR